ncbi:hypothetical protein [Niabella beijingensis]|uniref:hypothetical protein n=1 Tax=Niabella beijingensis TaxID=2872700 RepID=UPI001CBB0C8F|nr:hypothetical protein [Niabella beijingensis]MBZ4188857.1 hypothetical protein [Niabella beijingensis]
MIEIFIAFFLALWPSHPTTTATNSNGPIITGGVQVTAASDSTGGETDPIPPTPRP